MSGSRACHQIGDTSQELYIIHAIGGKTSRRGVGVLIERLAEGGGLKGARLHRCIATNATIARKIRLARRRETHHARGLRMAKIASLEVNYWRRGGTNPGRLPFSTLADNTARRHLSLGTSPRNKSPM